MRKIILYTAYDLKRDFEFIKFNELYEFENKYIKGSFFNFPTKEDVEKYFKWNKIDLEIKDEFWEDMRRTFIIGDCKNNIIVKTDNSINILIEGEFFTNNNKEVLK
jgi:hypothetical protein